MFFIFIIIVYLFYCFLINFIFKPSYLYEYLSTSIKSFLAKPWTLAPFIYFLFFFVSFIFCYYLFMYCFLWFILWIALYKY